MIYVELWLKSPRITSSFIQKKFPGLSRITLLSTFQFECFLIHGDGNLNN